jgi:acyl-CoA thioesterase
VPPFDEATTVEPLGDDRYRGLVDPSWFVRKGPNGGYLAALLLRALDAAVGDAARSPRSLTVHYLAPVDEGPVSIETRVERTGRSMTTLSARLSQGDSQGGAAALALAAYSSDRTGVEFDDVRMPHVPAPAHVPVFEHEEGPAFREHWEARLASGAPPFSGAAHAEAAVWMALRPPRPVDHLTIAALTDAWLPSIFMVARQPVAAPTVDLTIHFRSPVPESVGTGPCLGRFRTRLARGGFMDEEGEVWSQDGVLLAQSRQLALAVPA